MSHGTEIDKAELLSERLIGGGWPPLDPQRRLWVALDKSEGGWTAPNESVQRGCQSFHIFGEVCGSDFLLSIRIPRK